MFFQKLSQIKDFNDLKKQIRFWINAYNFNKVKEVISKDIIQTHGKMNIVLITLDSCRYDSLVQAQTPVLDKHGKIYPAWTPATYTLPAHMSFFTGIFPNTDEPVPYLNRFIEQLIVMEKGGKGLGSSHQGKKTIKLKSSKKDMIDGLRQKGFYTVGTGSATWFAKEVLVKNFNHFKYVQAQSAEAQCNYVLKKLNKHGQNKPFFAFMNFLETHTPYMHYGEDRKEYSMQARDFMKFPPTEDPELKNNFGTKLHNAQIKAAEHLDSVLGKFLTQLPKETFVIITADHGEAFGEDGCWGHGIYHPTVMQVPMMCFMLSGEQLGA